jgi:glutaredoxin
VRFVAGCAPFAAAAFVWHAERGAGAASPAVAAPRATGADLARASDRDPPSRTPQPAPPGPVFAATSAGGAALSVAQALAAASSPETPSAAAAADDGWRALLPSVDVVVYTTRWCPACRRAKAWLSGHGIAYEERDIEADDRYAHMMRAINPGGQIPTFDVEGDVMVGFDSGRLMAMRERAARKRADRWH